MNSRAVVAIGIGSSGLFVAACFPDYGVDAGGVDAGGGGEAAGGTDAGGATDAASAAEAGDLALAGSTSGYLGYPSPTTLQISYSVRNAGDLLVVGTYIANAATPVNGITDTLESSFISTPVRSGGTSGGCSGFSVAVELWYALAGAAGGDTLTIQKGGNDAFGAFLLEYSGLGAGVHLDGTAGASGADATLAMSGGTWTTSGATDVVIAIFADVKDYGVMAAGSGFTAREADGDFVSMIEDDLPVGAPPGAQQATATEPPGESGGGDGCWVNASAAFGP